MLKLYSFSLMLAAVFGSPYWIYRILRERRHLHNIRDRFGLILPEAVPSGRPLWIHAVSVGEVLAAKPLISFLHEKSPEIPIVVSTVTPTGQALAKKELTHAIRVFYFPFDWALCVQRFLQRLDPRAVVLMETELWPNFLSLCSKSGISVILANGRISDKSFGRYRHIRPLTRTMLEMVELLAVQTPEDKRRFVELGADESKIKVTGNLKFDFALPAADPASGLLAGIREVLSLEEKNPVIVIGSTMKGEEIHFLEAFRNVAAAVPGARMILAPRHPERFDEVAELIGRSGAPFCRRSRLEKVQRNAKAQILLLDSIGELRTVYALASIAVIGGSFLPFGGHNLLEPAALGKAIIFGPEMSNFKEMAALFLREKSARRCSLPELPGALAELLANESARSLLGQRAAATCRRNQGATETTAVLLQPYIRTVGAHV